MQGCKKNHYLIVVLGLAVSFGWFSLGGGQAGQNEKSPAVVRTFKGHKNVVYGVAFSPKGKYLVTGSWDKTLKMWDVNSGKVIRTFGGPSGHKEMVLTVDVSPDGRYIASGGQDRQLKIWDLPSTDARQQLDAKQELTGVDVSPDGKKLAIAGKDGVVRIHNSADFKKLLELTGHDGEVKSVQFSANGAVVGSSGVDGTLRFWNSANGQLINVIGAHEGAVNDLVIHPNNSNAYSVGEDGALRFWQLTAAKPREFTPMAKDIVVMEVSPDGNQVFTASADQKIRVSNYVNGQRRRELVGATSQVLSAGFNSNASQVAAGMKDGSVVVWNNGNGQIMGKVIAHDQVTGVSIRPQNDQMATVGSDGLLKVWNLPIRSTKSMKHPQEIMTAAMRSDGSRVYTGGKDKIVRSWVLSNNALERQFTGHPTAVTAIAVSPNGAYLASAGEDGVIRFWNQSNGQLTTKIGGHAGIVTSLSFNSQSNRLASCSADGTVKVWQLPVTDSRSLGHPDQVTSVVITPDGTRAVTGCNDKQVRLWNLSNGGLERAFGGHTLAIRAVGVSGNGQFVVGGGDDKSFSVWNLGNGQVIKKITVPNVIQAIALNRDGKLAVAGLADNSIKVFDVAKAKEKANFAGHQGAITGLAYTNGDKLLVSSSADKTIRVWDTANGKVRTTITHTGPVDAMAVSVDGQLVAGGSGKSIGIWNVADGKNIATLSAKNKVQSLSFSGNAKRLVVGEQDNAARIYDLNGDLVEFFPHKEAVTAVAFHKDGKRIVSTSSDKQARVWTSAGVWQDAQKKPLRQVVFTAKNHVVCGGDDNAVVVRDGNTGKVLQNIAAHNGAVVGLDANTDGSLIASAGVDKSIKVWNVADKGTPKTTITLEHAPSSLDISPDGTKLIVGVGEDKKGYAQVFDITTGQLVQEFEKRNGKITSVAFHTDNRTIVTTGTDKEAHVDYVGVFKVLDAHKDGATAVHFSNNGVQAVTGGADKTVKLWDLNQGKVLRTFATMKDPVTTVRYSRDYAQVGAAAGTMVKVWNVNNGQETAKFSHPANVTSLAFNSNRSEIVTGCEDKLCRLWETSKGQLLQFFSTDGPVVEAYYHPNNTAIITGGGPKVLVGTRAIQRVVAASKTPLYTIDRYSNGVYVLTGGQDKAARLWNVGNGNNDRTYLGAVDTITAVAFSRNNQMIAVADAKKSVRVYKFANAQLIREVKAPAVVQELSFNPSSTALAAGCEDKTVIAWDTTYPNVNAAVPDDFLKVVQQFRHDDAVTDVAFGADNATLYSSSADKTVRVWTLASPNPVQAYTMPNIVDVVKFGPKGKFIASAGHSGRIRIYEIATKRLKREIVAHKTKDNLQIYGLAFSPDGQQIVSAGKDKTLKLWNVANGAMVREFKAYDEKKFKTGHDDSVFSVAFSPDGKYIASASGGYENLIKIWNVSTGQVVRDLDNKQIKRSPGRKKPQSHPGWIYQLAFSKAGKELYSVGAARGNNGYVARWNVANGQLVAGKKMFLGVFRSIAIDPSGDQLAVGAGPYTQRTPEFNAAYLMKISELK